MENLKISNKGHAILFANRYFEFFTRSNPLVSWCMYLSVIWFFLYYSNSNYGMDYKIILFVFLMGLKFWSLFEYLIHRYVFHWVSNNPRVEKFTYLLHGNHHHFPKDKERLFMPPLPGLIMSMLVFLIMFVIAGKWAFAFFPGFILGHLLQSSLHYAIHARKPPFKCVKFLWRNHHLHHYSNEEKGFGITSPFWDYIFRTQFDAGKYREDEAQVKSLMFDKKKHSSNAI